MRVHRPDLQPGVVARECGRRGQHQRADRRGEAGQTHPAGGQTDVGGQLRVGRVDAADDLRRPAGQELPGLGQPYAPAGALQQLRSRLGFEASEVVADRGLRVGQLPRRGGDRSVAGDRVEHTQPGHIEHSSILSMDEPENWHWTDAP